MLKEVVEFCQELGLDQKSDLIQNFDSEPFLVLSKLIQRSLNYGDLNGALDIIKKFYTKWSEEIISDKYDYLNLLPIDPNNWRYQEIGAYVIGREINKTLKNEPKIFSQLNNVLAEKGKIAKMMFEGKDEEDETSKEEIFELLKHIQAGLYNPIPVRRL